MNWELETQFFLDGILAGTIYALVALGFTITWSSMRVVSLAQPSLLAIGAATGYLAADAGIAPAAAAAAAGAAAIGYVAYVVAIKPLAQVSLLSVMVSTLGAGIIIEGILALFSGTDPIGMPSLLPAGGWVVGPFYFRRAAVIVAVIAFVMLALALYISKKTRIGLAFRAAAWAPDVGSAHGINIAAVRTGSILFASAYAGLAGFFVAVLFGSWSPYMGLALALPALIGMLVGGAGNLMGAVLGGLTLGVIQSVSSAHITSSLSNLVAFGVLIGLMVIRPQGLLSER
jgi:branched-chain amino acid transport system permease protein